MQNPVQWSQGTEEPTARDIMLRIIKADYIKLPSDKISVTPDCLDLIAKIFQPKPEDRIKLADIRHHPWLAGRLTQDVV